MAEARSLGLEQQVWAALRRRPDMEPVGSWWGAEAD